MSFLAVLLFVGLAAAAHPQRDAVSGIFKDFQQKINHDVKQAVDHAKEDFGKALQNVKEAGQAPGEALQLIMEKLKKTAQKISTDGKTDTHAVIDHLKEAYEAIKAAFK